MTSFALVSILALGSFLTALALGTRLLVEQRRCKVLESKLSVAGSNRPTLPEIRLLKASRRSALVELSASIAHEINNPLASISAYAEQLVEAAQDPALTALPQFRKFPGHLATIRKNVKRCKEITVNLLEFAHARETPSEPVQLEQALDETLSLLTQEGFDTQKRIEKAMPESLPLVIAPRTELQQVLLNLLTNALDASGPEGAVVVRARKEDDQVAVEVEDRGRGIPEERQEQLFQPFFSSKPTGKAAGLGLAICARLVKKMKGRITFVSSEGTGTTFTIRLNTQQPSKQIGGPN